MTMQFRDHVAELHGQEVEVREVEVDEQEVVELMEEELGVKLDVMEGEVMEVMESVVEGDTALLIQDEYDATIQQEVSGSQYTLIGRTLHAARCTQDPEIDTTEVYVQSNAAENFDENLNEVKSYMDVCHPKPIFNFPGSLPYPLRCRGRGHRPLL